MHNFSNHMNQNHGFVISETIKSLNEYYKLNSIQEEKRTEDQETASDIVQKLSNLTLLFSNHAHILTGSVTNDVVCCIQELYTQLEVNNGEINPVKLKSVYEYLDFIVNSMFYKIHMAIVSQSEYNPYSPQPQWQGQVPQPQQPGRGKQTPTQQVHPQWQGQPPMPQPQFPDPQFPEPQLRPEFRPFTW